MNRTTRQAPDEPPAFTEWWMRERRAYRSHARSDWVECWRAAVAANADEIERMQTELDRRSAVIAQVNARCDHLGMRLGEIIRERDALRSELEIEAALWEERARHLGWRDYRKVQHKREPHDDH